MPAVTFPPYQERKTGSQRRRPGPRRVTLIQLDTSLNLREKRPGFLLAEAGHPFAQAGLRHLVERVPLFDGHIGGHLGHRYRKSAKGARKRQSAYQVLILYAN